MHLYNTTMHHHLPLSIESQGPNTSPLELGLKALTLDPKKTHSPSSHSHQHHHRSMTLSDFLSPTSSSSLSTGDYIGMESSTDVLKDCEGDGRNGVVTNLSNWGGRSDQGQGCNFSEKLRVKREEKWAVKNKVFPPPIPLLARTENLPSHMPWVLKRHYTNDGRLILTEEKVRHHEYFRAHRSNGRLTLQLVPMDDETLIPPFLCTHKENENEEIGNGNEDDWDDDAIFDDDDDDDEDGDEGDRVVEEEPGMNGIGVTAAGNKCFNFNSVGSGSHCIFGVPVPAIRQVHS